MIGPNLTKSIHTLNARGNVMLEVMRDSFELSPKGMRHEIQSMRQELEDVLSKKGISYDKLKSALVPDRKRREIALVFDTFSIESNWYGLDVFNHVLPLLDKKGNHSILVGDYLDRPDQTDQLLAAFEEAVQLRREVKWRHPSQFYVVYITNLTDAMFRRFSEGLSGYAAYVGFADMTYASLFKYYLSTMLISLGIMHGSVFIQGHEPDRLETDDINVCGYPLEPLGFSCRSVSSDLQGVLLTYKIERPVFPKFEVDTEFALNAISLTPMPLDDFTVEVQEAKLNYIKLVKRDSVARAGLEATTPIELSEIIKSKISASYIYNLVFLEDHDVAKFNIIIELRSHFSHLPTRLLAALEYKPEQKMLRLLTLY